jgi:hypothetical protein
MKCRRSKTSKGARLRRQNAGGKPARPEVLPGSPVPEFEAPPTDQPDTAAADLRIDRHTKGTIHHSGSVIVGPQGVVAGQMHARVIVVEGEVIGDLHAVEAIRIVGGGRVNGDVHAPKVAIASSAQLQGRLTMPRHLEHDLQSE